jgi:hypothetical protein
MYGAAELRGVVEEGDGTLSKFYHQAPWSDFNGEVLSTATAKESSMKRLAASLVFAAVILAPAAFAAQPKPTTRVIPCDNNCKYQQCLNKGEAHAKVVCGGAVPDNRTQCEERNARKYTSQCMRAPLGED